MTKTSLLARAIPQLSTGSTASVGGVGAAADLVRRQLRALGVAVIDAPEPVDTAANALLRLADGRRRTLIVSWTESVADPAITDETAVQAGCGVMHVNGRRGGRPRALMVDYCAAAAGALGMTGLLASLLVPVDELTVRTGVAETALLAISQYLAAAGADDPEAVDLAPGGPPFVSADDVRFEIESLRPEPWAAFWTALGIEPRTVGKGWKPFQFRYATATAPLPSALHDATRAHGFAALTRVAAEAGVSVCRLYRPDEPATPRPDALAEPWAVRMLPNAAGRRRDPLAATVSGPLAGLRVLEAGRRVQAPMAAHLLRLLGARVTRIEPPGGDPLRDMPPYSGDVSARWLALNRDKDAVEFDITSPDDRAALRAAATETDVFLHNWAPGKAEELGLSATDLPPGLVYTYTSGWSGLELDDLPPGTDFMVQARTGLAYLVDTPETPPAPSLMTLLDVLGGILGAEATVIGLLARRETSGGVAVESSLLGAADTLRRHGLTSVEAALRQPFRSGGVWHAGAGRDATVTVTTDLADLLTDPRFATVIGRDEHGCPALTTPWRLS
ncbi:CoA transferase [Nocardia brevicatena]|uniref:CoA transferase n=1 Tax=Nocardia brevicatena TaxID=37327 RepID=UPI0002FD345E|nr:CoA transferase [Nocardia brevicatena]